MEEVVKGIKQSCFLLYKMLNITPNTQSYVEDWMEYVTMLKTMPRTKWWQ